MLYDEATGDYSMNQRHYVIDLCKKYLPKGVNRPSDGSLHIYAHIDSDHARDLDTRRSVTACAIFGNGTLLSWKSKMQPTVAKSSMEAEYMAFVFWYL